MEKIDKLIEQFVKPPRFNFRNSLYDEKQFFPFFERIDFTVKTFDNKPLACIFFRFKSTEPHLNRVVLYNHSHGSCKFEGASLLGACAQNELSLLIYDSRGCGESGDDAIYFGFKEKIDVLFLILHLAIVHKMNNFMLWGRSIGCNAVLQFYQTLVSRDGDFLNRIMKAQHEKLHTITKVLPNGSTVITTTSKIQIPLYPPNFNKFINQYFEDFIMHNEMPRDGLGDITIKIEGLVLDSPYESFTSFLSENTKKFINFMPGMVSSIATMYLKNWMSSKLEVDIEMDQNIELITKINLNTVFIVSDKDEIVSYERYNNLVRSFAEKCAHKNPCTSINTSAKHGAKRSKDIILSVFANLGANTTPTSAYSFTYSHLKIDPSTLLKSAYQASRYQSMLISSQNESAYVNDQTQTGISLYKRSYNLRDNHNAMQSMSPKKNESNLINSNFSRVLKTSPSLSGYIQLAHSPVQVPSINEVVSKNDDSGVQGRSLNNFSELKSSLNTFDNKNEMRKSLDLRNSIDAQLYEHYTKSINPSHSPMIQPRGKSSQTKKPPMKLTVLRVDDGHRVNQEEGQTPSRQVGIRLVGNLK